MSRGHQAKEEEPGERARAERATQEGEGEERRREENRGRGSRTSYVEGRLLVSSTSYSSLPQTLLAKTCNIVFNPIEVEYRSPVQVKVLTNIAHITAWRASLNLITKTCPPSMVNTLFAIGIISSVVHYLIHHSPRCFRASLTNACSKAKHFCITITSINYLPSFVAAVQC